MILNHFANQDHKIGNYLLSLPQYQQKQLVLTMCLLFELLNHEELSDKEIFEIKTVFNDITVYEHPIQESWFEKESKASAFRIKNLLNKLETSESLVSFLDSLDTRIARTKSSQGNNLKTCFFVFVSQLNEGSDPSNGFIEFYELLQAKI
ncbi:MAG: hypothetical protein AB8G05_17410 [Oligoflexales bacterium]